MSPEQEDRQMVQSLAHGEDCLVVQTGIGGVEVYRINDMLFLFSVPAYGGSPRYENSFPVEDAVKAVDYAYEVYR